MNSDITKEIFDYFAIAMVVVVSLILVVSMVASLYPVFQMMDSNGVIYSTSTTTQRSSVWILWIVSACLSGIAAFMLIVGSVVYADKLGLLL